jgi:ABC-type Fe2+-enterobactin transport system substrate-binding protein
LSSELDTVEHYDEMNKVVELMLKGTKPMTISRSLNMRLVDVKRYIEEWQGVAKNNRHIQERAREALSATDQHYDLIIAGLWDVANQAELADDLKVRATTLKMIADIEQKRIEMLQKSGLLDNQQLAEQVVEAERQMEIVKRILREAANKYPEAAAYIRVELGKVSGQAESTVISVEPN